MIDIARLPAPFIVFAPHPDDETLGCGGLIALACRKAIGVHTIFVTDGSASHPGSSRWSRDALARIRKTEAENALSALGAADRARTFLSLSDGAMPPPSSESYAEAVTRIRAVLKADAPGTLVLPWRRDPHVDHRGTWALAREAAAPFGPFTVLEYPIWLDENGTAQDWPRADEAEACMMDVGRVRHVKEAAIAQHRSQLGEVIDDDPEGFVLTRITLARLLGDTERFWVSSW